MIVPVSLDRLAASRLLVVPPSADRGSQSQRWVEPLLEQVAEETDDSVMRLDPMLDNPGSVFRPRNSELGASRPEPTGRGLCPALACDTLSRKARHVGSTHQGAPAR